MVGQEILNRFPDILPREDESIFRKYVEAHQEEVDEEYDEAVESVKLSRQIEHASGEDLDRIGRIFGEVGRRTGRSDGQYRRYLKSVVQAFSGRGTDRSMREPLAAALDIPVEDVRLTEDFDNVEYEVILHDWTPHSVNNIYEIAEIVDPSGVAQSDLRYIIPDEDAQSAVDIVTTDGTQVVADTESSVDDILVGIGLQETFDDSTSSDQITDDVFIQLGAFRRWDVSRWGLFDWDEVLPGETSTIFDEVAEQVEINTEIDTSSSAVISEEDVEQVITEVVEHFDDVTAEIDDAVDGVSSSSIVTEQEIDDDTTEDTSLAVLVTENVKIVNIDGLGSAVTELTQEIDDDVTDTDEASDSVEEEVTDDRVTADSASADAATTESATVMWDDSDWDSMRWGHT